MIHMLEWLPDFPELAGIKVTDVSLDSREVNKGTLFIALKGFQSDGHDFINEAIEKGAVAVLCEQAPERLNRAVPICAMENLRERLGDLAHRFYGSVTKDLSLIGVTGTNGKTSTCQYIAQSMDFLGNRCGIIGTNGQGLWGQLTSTMNTTPDVIRLHAELARQKKQGAQFCAMEVSSHGLDQRRVDGVRFSSAVFTNLSRDHLDYHKTMDAYGRAKWKLMQWPSLKNAVINIDDAWAQQNLEKVTAKRIWTYSLEATADIHVTSLSTHSAGIDAAVTTPLGDVQLNLRLLGRFNLSNALAAFAVLLAEGVPLNTAARVVSNCNPVKGRMEMLRASYSPTVVIDYAHTPDALANALQACREHVSGRLGVVFGCGGDRDPGKRPEMAAVAEQLSDFVVVTDDNPRTEASEKIIADVCKGFKSPEKVMVIGDRKQAINQTLESAQTNDVILIAGKGHEEYQDINGVKHPFSDQDTVRLWQEVQFAD